MVQKYFHYISYLKWSFFVIGVFLAFSKNVFRPGNYLPEIGNAVRSLSDLEVISKQKQFLFLQ